MKDNSNAIVIKGLGKKPPANAEEDQASLFQGRKTLSGNQRQSIFCGKLKQERMAACALVKQFLEFQSGYDYVGTREG